MKKRTQTIPTMDLRSYQGKGAVQNLVQLWNAWLSSSPPFPGCCQARGGTPVLPTTGKGFSTHQCLLLFIRLAPLCLCFFIASTLFPLPIPDSFHLTLKCVKRGNGSLSLYRTSQLVRACPLGLPRSHKPSYI